MKKNLDCRDYQYEIQSLLNDKLNNSKRIDLLKHIDECEKCFDETKTQYLIREGLKRLENGENFNLDEDFKKMIKEKKNDSVRIYKSVRFIAILFSILLIYALLILLKGVFL